MTEKSPAFQFYPQDYLADPNVAEMTLEEQGAYIRLICYAWIAGSIPADPDRCARLVGNGCSISVATNVQRAFNEPSTDPQRLLHKRVEKERQKQAIRREQTSLAGKKSAAKRTVSRELTTSSNKRSTNGQRKVNPSSSSSDEDEYVSNSESHIDQLQQILDCFNAAFAQQCRLTESRKKALKNRLKDDWWSKNWREAIEKGARSEFLTGKNDRGWKIDFEFFLKPETVTKIMEGKYTPAEKPKHDRFAFMKLPLEEREAYVKKVMNEP